VPSTCMLARSDSGCQREVSGVSGAAGQTSFEGDELAGICTKDFEAKTLGKTF